MGGRFRCFICDGQVLSVLQEHGVEMLRPSMNAPRVDFSLVFAFAIRSAKVRRVVRNRVRATMEDETALKSAEATAWRVFEAARLGARPTEGRVSISARTGPTRAAALLWASSTLFSFSWEVVASSGEQQGEAGAPAAVAGRPARDSVRRWSRAKQLRTRPPQPVIVAKQTTWPPRRQAQMGLRLTWWQQVARPTAAPTLWVPIRGA